MKRWAVPFLPAGQRAPPDTSLLSLPFISLSSHFLSWLKPSTPPAGCFRTGDCAVQSEPRQRDAVKPKILFYFFWQNQAWQDESLPLLVYSIFLYWIFIDSFVLSVTITDTLLFLLALSRGLQQQFDRSIEYRIKHANCPLNMVFILMPVNSKISKCFFRFLSLLQIFLKSMKFW